MCEISSLIYSTDADINGLLNVIPRFSNNFLKTFISLVKHRTYKVCLPLLSHRMSNRWCSDCFTFLTNGYAFIRLVCMELYRGTAFCLMLSTLGNIYSDDILKYLPYFSKKTGFNISCKVSHWSQFAWNVKSCFVFVFFGKLDKK